MSESPDREDNPATDAITEPTSEHGDDQENTKEDSEDTIEQPQATSQQEENEVQIPQSDHSDDGKTDPAEINAERDDNILISESNENNASDTYREPENLDNQFEITQSDQPDGEKIDHAEIDAERDDSILISESNENNASDTCREPENLDNQFEIPQSDHPDEEKIDPAEIDAKRDDNILISESNENNASDTCREPENLDNQYEIPQSDHPDKEKLDHAEIDAERDDNILISESNENNASDTCRDPENLDNQFEMENGDEEECETEAGIDTNNNNNTDSNASVKEDEKKKQVKYVEKFYTDAKDTINVHLTTECGTCLEFYHVPRRYYASEITVLIVRDTGIRPDSFTIAYKGEVLKPMRPLEDLSDDKNTVHMELKLQREDEAIEKMRLGQREIVFKSGLTIGVGCRKSFIPTTPCKRENVLQVQSEKGGALIIQRVHIDWLPEKHHKPFLGGYRHTVTDTRYLHASSQSKPLPKAKRDTDVYSRETQTYRMKHFGHATVNEMSTQFSKPGFYRSNAKDKLRIPGPYETAEEYLARVLRDVIIIQKYTRRWIAKRRVNRLREIRDAYLEWVRKHVNSLKDDREAQLKRDFERRLHPRTQADFDRLFNALEQWKREEIAKIDAESYTVAERKALLALLLDKETELIAAIGRHQLCAASKGQHTSQINMLKKAAAPIRWTSAINGRALEVETPQTLRAKELIDVLISLRLDCLTAEERLDILLTAKRTVSPYPFKVCGELVKLIDREAELIVRKVSVEQLKGLRQRILHQFIKFSKIPEANPEVANYIKVPTGSREKIAESLRGDVHYCLSCDRYLRNTAFPLSARANQLAPCEACLRLDNRARKRMDLDPYQRMLFELQKKEMDLVEKAKQNALKEAKEAELKRLENGEPPQPEAMVKIDGTDCNVLNSNPFPFLVNGEDIRFLVDDVWERRSILSGWLNIMDLVLTRWRLNEPWSPWNMLLVTREEAEAHENLGKFPLELIYAHAMLNTVNQRLVMGRNAFPRLRKNGIEMAHDEILLMRRLQKPENNQSWLEEKRKRLPPLAKHHNLLESREEWHRPVYQPPEHMLPAIRGERRLSEVNAPGEEA